MINNLSSVFLNRQYMISKDFEIYYYKDRNLRNVEIHSHEYYEFYFFLEGEVTMFLPSDEKRGHGDHPARNAAPCADP